MSQNKAVLKESIHFVGEVFKIKNVYSNENMNDITEKFLNNKEFLNKTTDTLDALEKVVYRVVDVCAGLVLIFRGVSGFIESENSKEEEESSDTKSEEEEKEN